MGSVFYDPGFHFPNGGPAADKLLILLTEPIREDELYVFVWANTQDVNPKIDLGCYADVQFFFIPANVDFFKKNTWIYLYDSYAALVLEYTTDHYKGFIKDDTLGRLIKCIEVTEAIAEEHIQSIKKSWKRKCKKN